MKTTASSELLAPAFRNKWELIVFLLFVVFVLSFPFIPKEGWIDRGKLYLNIPDSSSHGFEYFAKTIWNHPGDIDVLLVGNSALGSGFRPDLLKKKLAHLTGEREPVVFLTDHNGDHIEIEYMQIKDLLARKKIKLLIWNLNSDAARYDDRHADGLWDFYTHHEFLSTLMLRKKQIYTGNQYLQRLKISTHIFVL